MSTTSHSAPTARSVYVVEEDIPGRRLVLTWRGSPPRRGARWLAVATVAAILVATLAFARYQYLPVIDQLAAQPGGDAIGMAVLGGLLIVGGLVSAFYVARGGGAYTRYVSRIAWDASDGIVEISESGWMLFARRRRQISLGAIRALEMTAGSETSRTGLLLRLSLAHDAGGEREEIALALPVDQLDRRSEAMDLLFRIARICGYPRYTVLRSDPRELRIELAVPSDTKSAGDAPDDAFDDDDPDDEWDEQDEDEEAQETQGESQHESEGFPGPTSRFEPQTLDVPFEYSAAHYEANDAPRAFVEPEVKIPPIDADFLADALEPSHLVEWDPPGRFRMARDGVSRNVLIASGVACGLLGAGLGAWLLYNFATFFVRIPPSRWDSAAFGGLVGALLGPLLIWAFNRQREVTIDRATGTITCRHGEIVRSYTLDELCEVTLIGQQQTQTETNGSGGGRQTRRHTAYRCRVELAVGQAGEWAFDSGEWNRDANRGYRPLLSMSIALARSLGVPWRWQDDGRQNTAQWFGRLGWKERGAVAAMVISILSYPALLVVKERWSVQGVERVKAAGAEVSFLSGFSIGNQTVLENYWKIEFTPATFDLDRLRAAVPAIGQISRAGLLLCDTGMGDAGLRELEGANNLLLLDLTNTRITLEGLSALAAFDRLEYLNLCMTIVDDKGLERLAPLPKLRFLMLATTQVTDAGLVHVEKFPRLEYVGLHNLVLSADAIARLRAARPKLVIGR